MPGPRYRVRVGGDDRRAPAAARPRHPDPPLRPAPHDEVRRHAGKEQLLRYQTAQSFDEYDHIKWCIIGHLTILTWMTPGPVSNKGAFDEYDHIECCLIGDLTISQRG